MCIKYSNYRLKAMASIVFLLAAGCLPFRPTPVTVISGTVSVSHNNSSAGATAPDLKSLSLETAIQTALKNNPGLQAAAYRADAFNARQDIAEAKRMPVVTLDAGYTNYLDSQRLVSSHENGDPGVFSRNMYSAGLTVSIPLFTGGRITSDITVSQLLSQAAVYRQAGMTRLEAVRKAAPVRVRPILMTQLTTVLGLVPLALNLGEGGDMLKPMAVAVIGGLLYSLLLTLFFLPAVYIAFRKRETA